MDHMTDQKRIALVAHDGKKADLIEWCEFNKAILTEHKLYATGTTGRLIDEAIGVDVNRLKSGPLGGDQQIGALIADGGLDMMIFFWDPLASMSHDVDVKALLRIATVWNIPIACNRATADFLFASTLMDSRYERIIPNYDDYTNRDIPG